MNPRFVSILERFTDAPILPTSRFKEDLGLDSMQLVRLAVELEDAFFISIPDDVIGKLYTVSDAQSLLQQGS